MSIRAAQRLQKLNDRHRLGAYLIGHGFSYAEVSRELGGHQFYWGRLVNHSRLFQEYLYIVRDEVQREYLADAVNRWAEKLRRRRQRQQYRPRKSNSLRSDILPAAAAVTRPTPPPGQTATDGMVNGAVEQKAARLDAEIARLRVELKMAPPRPIAPTVRTVRRFQNAQGLSGRR